MLRRIFLLMLVVFTPANCFCDDFELTDFFAPRVGDKNIYSCIFPCNRIEITSTSSSENKIYLKESYYFSEEAFSSGQIIPKNITHKKVLTLLDNSILYGNLDSGTIILKEPLKTNTFWEIFGVMSNNDENAKNDIKRPKQVSVSWDCRIGSYGRIDLLSKERKYINVECESNYDPKLTIYSRYASDIGLFEQITKDTKTGRIVNEQKILSQEEVNQISGSDLDPWGDKGSPIKRPLVKEKTSPSKKK
jgi:hypothetical protein